MNYHYNITLIDETEHWIFISHDHPNEADAFVNLVTKIREACHGRIEEIGSLQYRIDGDGLGLIYQWDSCFGTVVIYNEAKQKEETAEFLKRFF